MKSSKLSSYVNVVVFLLCATVLFLAFFIEKVWGSITLEQIIFHMHTPLALENALVYETITRVFRQIGTIYLITIVLYVFLVFKVRHTFLNRWLNIAICFFPVFLVVYLENKHNILEQIQNNQINYSMFIEQNYKLAAADFSWKKKKNLVFIIVESLENTYADISIFNPPLTPQLRQLQQENVSFDVHLQTPGTEWTIAGITSYLFGIPLKLHFSANNYGLVKSFLPKATSTLEIMEDAGYTISFVSGWETIFSGYANLISSHSSGENFDQIYFEKQGYSMDKHAGAWGFNDSLVFSKAESLFASYQAKGKPFALILNTIDTHPPSGFSDENFKKYNDIRDAYLSLDDKLYTFVQNILAMGDENTSIIIGDHLSMQNTVSDAYLIPNNEKRAIYNCFINPYTSPKKNEPRIFTGVDIAPSILEAIGCELPNGRFGLGVSLFQENLTLLEQDKDKYIEEIVKRSKFYNTFFH